MTVEDLFLFPINPSIRIAKSKKKNLRKNLKKKSRNVYIDGHKFFAQSCPELNIFLSEAEMYWYLYLKISRQANYRKIPSRVFEITSWYLAHNLLP